MPQAREGEGVRWISPVFHLKLTSPSPSLGKLLVPQGNEAEMGGVCPFVGSLCFSPPQPKQIEMNLLEVRKGNMLKLPWFAFCWLSF